MWWSWRYQIPALVEAGYRVVAPDLRGYNDTDTSGPYDMDTIRDDVVALLDHLGAEKAIVVAHDWGGYVGWHLASTRQARCSALVAMNSLTPSSWPRRSSHAGARSGAAGTSSSSSCPSCRSACSRAITAPARSTCCAGGRSTRPTSGPQELEPLAAAVRMPGRPSGMIGWYRAAARAALGAGRAGPQAFRLYEKITIPTLVLWAMDDSALGYEDMVPGTDRFAPGVEVQTIPRCGHFVQQEQPREVNRRLLEFLGRTVPDPAGTNARCDPTIELSCDRPPPAKPTRRRLRP